MPASTKTEVMLWVPPKSIAAMVPLLVALPSAIDEAEGDVFKASRINRLERALVGEGVRFNKHRRDC